MKYRGYREFGNEKKTDGLNKRDQLNIIASIKDITLIKPHSSWSARG